MSRGRPRYRRSGQCPPGGLLLAALLGLLGLAPIAWVYGNAMFGLSEVQVQLFWFVDVRLFLMPIYGMFVGLVLNTGLHLGKVRNYRAALGLGFVFGLLAVWAGWVGFFEAKLQQWVWDPRELARLAAETLEQPPTGAWIMEALAIMGSVLFTVRCGQESQPPFCEKCNRWLKTARGKERFAPEYTLEAVLTDTRPMQRVPESAGVYLTMDLTGCEHLHLLSLRKHQVNVDEKGQSSTSSTTEAEHVLLTPEEWARVNPP